MRFYGLILIFLFSSLQVSFAQVGKTFLYGTCSLVDEPESAYFLYSSSGVVDVVTAKPLNFEGDPEAGVQTFGAELPVVNRREELANFWLVCEGASSQRTVGPRRKVDLKAEGAVFEKIDQVRELLLERKQILSDLRTQLAQKSDHLKRLRADAGLIGGYERILLLTEQVGDLKVKVESLKTQNEHTQADLERLQYAAVPLDLPVKERLIKHNLNQLAQAYILERSRQKELNAIKEDPQTLVSLANTYDIQQLQQQLAALRVQRMDLERQYGQGATHPTVPDVAAGGAVQDDGF